LRLEIIAILSGFVSPPEALPATSCDAIPPGGVHISAGKPTVRLEAGRAPRPRFQGGDPAALLVRFIWSEAADGAARQVCRHNLTA